MKSERAPILWALDTGIGRGIVQAAENRTLLDRLRVRLLRVASASASPSTRWSGPTTIGTWSPMSRPLSKTATRIRSNLHAATWAVISEGASEAQLYQIQYGNPYNKHQWENPADFQSQLSMYRVKVAYIWLMRLMEPVTGLANALDPAVDHSLARFRRAVLCTGWRARTPCRRAFILAPVLMLADQVADDHRRSCPTCCSSLVSLAGALRFRCAAATCSPAFSSLPASSSARTTSS